MYKISGKIIVKESGMGIPNLIVALYQASQIIRKRTTSTVSKLTIGSKNLPAPTSWDPFANQSLGSVITNENGGFELSLKLNASQKSKLILLVLAPEETTSKKDTKITQPKPINDRILYYSYQQATGTDQTQNCLIRLSGEQLKRFKIPYVAPSTTHPPSVTAITASLKQSAEFQKEIQAVFTAQIQEKAKTAIDLKQKTTKAFQNFSLSALSPESRRLPTYLNPGEKPIVISANGEITGKQKTLIETRLAAIPNMDQSAGRKLALNLTRDQVEALGLAVGDPQKGTIVDGQADLQKVLAIASQSFKSTTLVRARSPFDIAIADCEAEDHFYATIEQCGPETSKPNEPGQDMAIEIGQQIANQVAFMTPPEKELSYGIEKDGEIVPSFPKAGPADVTSYHDFHSIQIAFDHIWSEVFDGNLGSLLRNVYSEMVRYKKSVLGTDHFPTVDSVTDMSDLYQDFIAFQEIFETTDQTPTLMEPVPQHVKYLLPEIIDDDWSRMTSSERIQLIRLAEEHKAAEGVWNRYNESQSGYQNDLNSGWKQEKEDFLTKNKLREDEAKAVLTAAQERIDSQPPTSPQPQRKIAKSGRLTELMTELDGHLSEPYRFSIFAKNSLNYGIMLTYRQAWTPQDYQVGNLVSTIPLTPKEVRKYSTKRVVKKSRAQKEIDDRQSNRSAESTNTSRTETEIVKQAQNRTSFEQTASGSVSVGVFTGNFGTNFGVQAEKSSSDTKKNFREAVLKSAEEYKQQHRLEVETSVSEEVETTSSGELTNPNDEITVTYLFYELQRQYNISEKLHQLTPIILVANDVPSPEEIDEDWLIANDWILRRCILDESFLPALHYVTTSIAGDELALQIQWDNVLRQARLVDALTNQVETKTTLAENAFKELKNLFSMNGIRDNVDKLKEISLAMIFGPFSLAGGSDNSADKREEIAKMAIERADKETQEVSAKLTREVTALQETISKYTQALQEHFDRQTAIARLRIHIKDNILYYMQAIWDYEPPDQRFFRLYNVDVPWIETTEGTVTVTNGLGGRSDPFSPNIGARFRLEGTVPITYYKIIHKKLSEVADLDNLLGYKGNYMIFPVRELSHIHLYMMQDYIDPVTGGLRDPDEFANYTSQEILDYVCHLQKCDHAKLEEEKGNLLNLLKQRMASPRPESSLVIIPTDSLYIEALPGKHPIMEDFKLTHRALDVKKVQSEVRHAELENLRLAARLIQGEREDPDIDKKIVIERDGNGDVIVPPEA